MRRGGNGGRCLPARYSRVFTTSTRVRLHTWRLGLTALILKNCRLSPTISTPPALPLILLPGSFELPLIPPAPSLLSFPPPTPPPRRHYSRSPFPRRGEIAPLCTVEDKVLWMLLRAATPSPPRPRRRTPETLSPADVETHGDI